MAAAAVPVQPASAVAFTAPPVGHVWMINLENETYGNAFANTDAAPYLAGVLPRLGALIPNYFGIGHNSLDNYIAEVSGQAPDSDTQSDCGTYYDLTPGVGPDLNGQFAGQGCVYPAGAKTLVDQLDPAHADHAGTTWKGYMEDMGKAAAIDHGTRCPHPVAPSGATAGELASDDYVMKHDPFVFFHSIVDDPGWCAAHVASTDPLARDLDSLRTTPRYSFIVPSITNTGHDSQAGQFVDQGDAWLRFYIPMIMASPAFRQDGMIVVTFDEAGTVAGVATDGKSANACCGEMPGPNSAAPGLSGQGGGQTGAVVISPFVRPGTVDDTGTYNHYSLLRSIEDAFRISTGGSDGLGHLGFAGSSLVYGGPGAFGCDVYTAYQPCMSGNAVSAAALPGTVPRSQPSGPRLADGSYTWRSPGPQGNDLHGIACASISTCIAAGDVGTVLRTADSGATWTLAPSGTTRNLSAIACPTSTRCVAVGGGGTVLSSVDGGQTWTAQSGAPNVGLHGVACADAATCVAVGDAGSILRSLDGGATWKAPASGTTLDLTGAWCGSLGSPAKATCLATGPYDSTSKPVTLLESTDGGATWQGASPSSSAVRLMSVACPTSGACLAVGDTGTVVASKDGGSTWSRSQPFHVARLNGVSCTSATSCVAVGDGSEAPTLVSKDATPGLVLATSDGGSTFQSRPSATTHPLRAVACPDASHCYAVGDGGAVVVSGDGARSWQSRTPGAEGSLAGVGCHQMMGPMCEPQSVGAWRAVSCPSGTTCYAVGTNAAVIGSTDGGATWSEQSSDLLPSPSPSPQVWPTSLDGVSCAALTTCVAVGSYASMLQTQDSGKHWRLRCTSITPAPKSSAQATCPATSPSTTLRAVSCPSSFVCVAVGDAGTVLRTPDGGSTWTASSSGTLAGLNGVSCASATQCVAVGSGGTVLRSVDGGVTWSAAVSGTGGYLAAVSCVAGACTAAGEGGTALRSDDGGMTWVAQSTGVGDQLLAVTCDSTTTCSATGSDGTVVSTVSSGAAWTVQGTGTNRALDATSCPSTSHCIAVGDAGAVLTGQVTAQPPPVLLPPPSPPGPLVAGQSLPNTAGAGASEAMALLLTGLAGVALRRRSRQPR